jgi:type IV pilus assembly protein PilY1
MIARAFALDCLLLLSRASAQECVTAAMSPSVVHVEYDAVATAQGRSGVIVFEASDDGTLRARERTTDRELWAYQPPEVTAATAGRGLMTGVAVLRFDANGDGVIDASGGDKVWIYFGLKRAGPYYYALDVTHRTPDVLWTAGTDTLEGLGEAWSSPTVARVRIGSASQNGEKFVIFVGGGTAGGAVGDGNRLFMLDAATGRLLWSAGDGVDNDRVLPQMSQGIAARVAVLDIDGDQFADRMYAADVGGRLWRFDIWNGRVRNELVTGGLFASLGAVEPLSPVGVTASDARRFFNAPDVAFIHTRGSDPYFNLALGSGDPNNLSATGVHDRFYSVRDREPFMRRSQSAYDAATPLFDADLIDITSSPQGALIPDDAPGWKLDLGVTAERVLTESITASGTILFTTHRPATADSADCEPTGTNRVYAVKVNSGTAALDLNDDEQITEDDRSSSLDQQGLPGELRIELEGPAGSATLPGAPSTPDSPGSRCYVGAESMSACMTIDALIRTFWKRTSVN